MSGGERVYDAPMRHDPIAQSIETFDQANGDSVGFYKDKGA